MSRGAGHVERSVLDLLRHNKHMSAPALAALVYLDDATLKAGDWRTTRAQRVSVRRVLVRLQRRGKVFKLGNMFQGERCSYANRENTLNVVRDFVAAFGNQALLNYPEELRLLYAEDAAMRASKK